MATLEMTFTKGALDKAAHTGGAATRYRDARYPNLYLEVGARSKTWRFRKFWKGQNFTETLGTWPQMSVVEAAQASEPLVALLNEIAHTGVCPDDLRGNGCISTATLAREVWARGGLRQTTPRTFANDTRNRFGASTAKNCILIERTDLRSNSDGTVSVYAMKRTDRDGIKLPPLPVFRSVMADVTGEKYPADGDWSAYEVPNPSSVWDDDANGGESRNVERYVRDQGEVVKDDLPF